MKRPLSPLPVAKVLTEGQTHEYNRTVMDKDLKISKGTKYLVTVAALVIVIAGLHKTASLLVPFLLAVFIAVISSSPLFWLKRRRVPIALAILIVVVGMLLIGLLISIIIGTSLNDFSTTLPLYQERLQMKAQTLLAWLESMGVERLDKEAILKALDPGASMQLVASLLLGLKAALTNGFLILLTVIFILLEASSFPVKIRAIFSDPEVALSTFDKFTTNLQRYIAIKTLTSIATGVIVAIWLLILGVDYPLLWGFLAFILNYIPTIGSILAAIPAAAIALIQLGPGYMALVLIGFLVVNVGIGSIMEPRVMGRGLGLSTLVVFLSLVFWGAIFGPVGMLLSVPLTMTLKIALDSSEETRWIATLLGSEKNVT